MLQINDRVKTTKTATRVYIVIGFDNPLPHTGGGVSEVIVQLEGSKSKRLRRLNPNYLVREDGTEI